MIFYQHTKRSPNQQKNEILNDQHKRKTFQTKQNNRNVQKKEANECFCFRSKRDQRHKQDQDGKFEIQPDLRMKQQALRLSRQIASKNFKNLKNIGFYSKNTFSQNNTSQTTKTSFQKVQRLKSGQKLPKNSQKKLEKTTQGQKDEFNMSRITFSAINRSYQKTVSNTVSSNNTSMSFESNILGSVVSQAKNDLEKLKSQNKISDESFSMIHSLNRRKNQNGIKSEPKNRKSIKVLKTKPQIQPIKQQNEQIETKKYKFIRVKAKDLPPRPINFKLEDNLNIKKVQTEEKLASNKELEDLEMVKYDYSSIVIDFFNMDFQTLQNMEEQRRKQISQNVQSQQNFQNHHRSPHAKVLSFSQQELSISKQASFCSLASYNPVPSISTSNIRSILASNGLSSDSNLLSMSINNNFSECSFDSIPRKEIKRGYGGFDGLSCINENDESSIEARNQSEESEINGKQALNY